MNCPSCGRELVAGADRCGECGALLAGSATGEGACAPAGTRPGSAPASSAQGTAGPLREGEVFAGRYRIRRLLGAGGMGAVYEAWDESVNIPVALKIIRPEAVTDPRSAAELEARLRRELVLARQVTHRNVVRIHDLGEVDGVTYLSMSFIEGEELAARLRREGAMPVRDALRLVRGVVAGLAAAHEAGVVHRDLKPGNIMIEAGTGQPYIMDFGIARSADGGAGALDRLSGGGAAAADTTQVGSLLGTLQYMAPEQFLGEAVDGRADIYAVGLILYDLLLGPRRPRDPEGAMADLRRRAEQPPPAPRTADAQIPEALDRLVIRCLEPDPDDRFADAAELAAELDRLDEDGHPLPPARTLTGRLLGVAAVLVLVLLGGTWWLASRRGPPAVQEPVSILVADLENRTGEASFDGAVEQALTIAMEGAPFISAYSRASARRTARALDLGEVLDADAARLVSRREGVGVVLAPRLEREAGDYRLTVRALDPAAEADQGRPLAVARARAADQQRVLEAVGKAGVRLRRALGDTAPEAAQAAAAETFTAASLDAMRAYARGQELTAAGRFDEALAAYRSAVEADPAFGRAWAGMGVVHGNLHQQDEAEAAYQKALEHISRMSERERYRTLGGYYLLVSRNYEQAVQTYQKLVSAYPADSAGHSNLALAALSLRDFQGALTSGHTAVELAPNSIVKRTNFAMYAMYAGDFDTARRECERVLEQRPGFLYALLTIARAAAADGDMDAARRALAEMTAGGGPGAAMAELAAEDLQMMAGRYLEAETSLRGIIGRGADADHAPALLMLAETLLAQNRFQEAASTAARAAAASDQESVLYPAARVLLRAGKGGEAEALAKRLEAMLQTHTTAAARLVRGERALLDGRLPDALAELRASRQAYDWWFAHYVLGRAYLDAGQLPEALDELQTCVSRHGEVVDVFLLDASTLRYWPPALYWLGRAHEAMGDEQTAAEQYRAYLQLRPAAHTMDALAAEAAARLGAMAAPSRPRTGGSQPPTATAAPGSPSAARS